MVSSSIKVLVVEDDRHAREIVQRVLSRDVKLRYLNIEVIQAADGEEGIASYLEHRPDLVIVDLLLPRVNGFKVIETIRAQPDGRDRPILVTTGVYRDRKTLKQLEQQGVQVLLKPFLPQALAAAVRQMLSRVRPPAAPPPGPAAKPPRPTPETPRLSLQEASRVEGHVADEGAVVSGELGTLGLPRMLLDALEEQLTGTLALQRGKVRKVIHLTAGLPVFVQSNLRSETLGQMLVRRGKIGADQHTLALDRSKRDGIKYGEALVRLGYLSDGEVMEELAAQTRLKIAGCLGWTEGSWTFTEDRRDASKVPRCVVDPLELVFEDLQRRSDLEAAFSRLTERVGHRVQPTRRFALHQERLEALLGSDLTRFLAREPTVQELIRHAGTPQKVVLWLDLLVQTGLAELAEQEPSGSEEPSLPEMVSPVHVPLEQLAALEPEPAAEPEAPPDAWEESSAVVWLSPEERARITRRPGRDSEEVRVALQLIQSTYLTLHEADHYQVLGVTPRSDADSIEVAYQIKRKQFDLGSFRDMDLGEHYAHLEEICTALDAAHEVLGDPDRRAAYDRTRGKSASQEERGLALDAEMHCRRGEELFNRKRYDKAEKAFAEAVDLDGQVEYQAKFALAFFMARRGQGVASVAADAMLLVQEALADDPGDHTAHLVAATICREVGHVPEAVHHLEELVRIDPVSREAFEALEQLLVEQGDVEGLELQYRRALHLLGDRDRARAGELWRGLTLLYRDRLQDTARARTACEVTLRYNPHDRELRELLAEMDHRQPERWPQAVLGYRSLLAGDPEQAAPLHRLFQLHLKGGREDAAFIAASAAVLRDIADDQELPLFRRHRPRFVRRASGPLEPPMVESLRHADDDPALAVLFQVLTPLIQRLHPLRLADVGVEPKDIVPDGGLPEGFASVLGYVAGQLSMDPPGVALNLNLGGDVQSAGTDPPLLLCGVQALELADRLALTFLVARALYRLGPGRCMGTWRPRRMLRDHVLAALSVAFPALEVPDPSGDVARVAAELTAAPQWRASVEEAVARLRGGVGTLNLADWQRGIQRTADRVGLLLCTDLVTAGRIVQQQDSHAERDLVDFALGQTYGELRRSLGLAVG